MPATSRSWTCTKISGPPSLGAIKPYPRSGLKNLTCTWHAHLIPLQRTVSAPTRPEGEQRRRTGVWHTRLRLFGTKRVMPEELYPKSGLAAGRLIHCFDRISADGLDRLVTVRANVSRIDGAAGSRR